MDIFPGSELDLALLREPPADNRATYPLLNKNVRF